VYPTGQAIDYYYSLAPEAIYTVCSSAMYNLDGSPVIPALLGLCAAGSSEDYSSDKAGRNASLGLWVIYIFCLFLVPR
jgi:hypothetical protein